MPNFISYDPTQLKLITVNFQDQLPRGTFEHAIDYLIENKLDLHVFDSAYRNDENGRPAYDPAILLKIVLFAYSKGITSSREIQWCCECNVTFKALSCDTVPHFTTIASFIRRHPQAVHAIFEQIILTCHEEGLIGNELFAIDGCKLPSDAAKEWSGTFKELRNKRNKLKRQITQLMKQHKTMDAIAEDKQAAEVKAKTAQTIHTLEKAHKKIQHFLATEVPRKGEGKRKTEVKSNITDNDSAKMTTSKGTYQGYNAITSADKKHQIIIDAQVFGSGPEQHTLTPVIEAIRERFSRLDIPASFTPEGIIITADTGFSSEENMVYLHKNELNAYVPDNKFRSRDPKFSRQKEHHPKPSRAKPKETQTYSPTDFIFDEKKMTCECPAGKMLNLRQPGKDKKGNDKVFFEGKIGQCRHCPQKNKCLQNPASANKANGRGRQVSFIIHRATPLPNKMDWMKKRIDSDEGKLNYRHRMSVIEPVFGNICSNKKLNRLSLRGKEKVQSQWQLYCMVHNIEKLMNYGKLAA